jgi:hypothetical protein
MRTFEQQLVSVGFKPSFQPSPTTTHQEFAPVRASNRKVFEPKSLETILDGLIEPMTKPRKVRKIVVTRCGGHYRARYFGTRDAAFGMTVHEATSRVKLFSGSTYKFQVRDKYV